MSRIITNLMLLGIIILLGNRLNAHATLFSLNSIFENNIIENDESAQLMNVKLSMNDVNAHTCDQVCVNVTVENFINILGMQFSINYDPDQLEFVSVGNFGLSGLSENSMALPSNAPIEDIRLSWIDNALSGVTLTDGTVLFELCFKALGTDVTTNIEFSGTPVSIEFINSNSNLIASEFSNSTVTITPFASIIFREKKENKKDGTWGFLEDEIPGFDHVAFNNNCLVYESHPGYDLGIYTSSDGTEMLPLSEVSGIQQLHNRLTFEHDAIVGEESPVIGFKEIPISASLADQMQAQIETVISVADFQLIDFSNLDGIELTLSPPAQKGGNNSFTCVGLVEWAAEQAGHNGGQGFIPNQFESFVLPIVSREIPLLSPELLCYAMSDGQTIQSIQQYVQGFFDPVDFIITDPLGRRLGFAESVGSFNETPNSFYSGDGNIEQILIPTAIPGNYSIQLIGKGDDVFVALSAIGNEKSFSGILNEGEIVEMEFFVEPQVGSSGDVNFDGEVNEEDVIELSSQLNNVTDDLTHPGDLDGDGFLSTNDLDLLIELVGILNTVVINDCSLGQIHFDGELEIGVEEGLNILAEADSGISNISFSPSMVSCNELGQTIPIEVTVTSNIGNTATCFTTVEVKGLPCGFKDVDINCSGEISYDTPSDLFTLTSTGCLSFPPYNSDLITFAAYQLCGDGEIVTQVKNLIGNGWAGITMRETTQSYSKKVQLLINNGNFARREIRTNESAPSYPQQIFAIGKKWLKIVRNGNQFSGFISPNGMNWQLVMAANISMSSCISIGLVTTNANLSNPVSADFKNTTIDIFSNNLSIPNWVNSGVDFAGEARILDEILTYPNPIKEKLNLLVSTNLLVDSGILKIFNSLGQELYSQQILFEGNQLIEVDLSNINEGSHFIILQLENGSIFTKRILKVD